MPRNGSWIRSVLTWIELLIVGAVEIVLLLLLLGKGEELGHGERRLLLMSFGRGFSDWDFIVVFLKK